MTPPNATPPLALKVFGCRLQPIVLVALLISFAGFANATRRVHSLTLTISPSALPDGTTGVVYKAHLRAQGGSGRYQFSPVNGDLPQGLSLGRNGAVTGTPQSAGSSSFRVLVTDLPRRDRGEATISLNITNGIDNSGSSVSVSVSPNPAKVVSGASQQFSASVSNTSNTRVTWSASKGNISSEGTFTAPSVSSTTNVMVMATSVADPSKSAQASVSVDPAPQLPVSVSITPTSASVASGAAQQFSATVNNASNPSVTWSASNGTISPSGTFTAPTVTTTIQVTVVATSVADPSKSAQASVSVNPPTVVSVSITPASAEIVARTTQQFSATVSNASNRSVAWSASNGTISPSGMFTAPSVTATTNVTVTATSVADSTQSAQAMVTVDPPTPPATSGGILLGISRGGVLQEIADMETWMGKQHAIVFTDPHAGIDWLAGSMGTYGTEMTSLWNSGHVPLIGWGSLWPLPAGCSSVNCSGQNIDANIANGLYDAGLDASASALKTWLAGPDGIYGNADDRRVYLRPSQEVNGNFFVWSPNVNGNTAQDYINAWRHIWTIFMVNHGLDSSHVQWIYCVSNDDFGGGTIESDYPGSSYVDWMGVDGYSSNRFAGEMDPPTIFDTAIGRLQALAPSKPLAINETAYDGIDSCSQSSSQVVCKDTWLSNLYNYIQTKGVKQIEYFDENGYDWMVFGCANSSNCPDGSGQGTLLDAADGSITLSGYTYNFYSAYKNAVSSPAFLSTDTSNPRLLTDALFQGH